MSLYPSGQRNYLTSSALLKAIPVFYFKATAKHASTALQWGQEPRILTSWARGQQPFASMGLSL